MKYNLHIIDWLSWQIHPGYTLTMLMWNVPLAYAVARSIAKPPVPTPLTNIAPPSLGVHDGVWAIKKPAGIGARN